MKKGIWNMIRPFLIALAATYILMHYVFLSAYVPTGSMSDTILPGDRVFGIRYPNHHVYQRGEIIVFKDPEEAGRFLVKRIIGLPGEIIEINKNCNGSAMVSVNGKPLCETYLPEPMAAENSLSIMVPQEGYFVLGDNRNQSYDARFWANKIIYSRDISGVVKVRYWPLRKNAILK